MSPGGSTADELFESVREELADQSAILTRLIQEELRPLLAAEGLPIVDYDEVSERQQALLRDYFRESVQPSRRSSVASSGTSARAQASPSTATWCSSTALWLPVPSWLLTGSPVPCSQASASRWSWPRAS